MTLTALIIVNVILGAAAVYGLILLLGHGIRSDRPAAEAQVRSLPQRDRDRLAA